MASNIATGRILQPPSFKTFRNHLKLVEQSPTSQRIRVQILQCIVAVRTTPWMNWKEGFRSLQECDGSGFLDLSCMSERHFLLVNFCVFFCVIFHITSYDVSSFPLSSRGETYLNWFELGGISPLAPMACIWSVLSPGVHVMWSISGGVRFLFDVVREVNTNREFWVTYKDEWSD